MSRLIQERLLPFEPTPPQSLGCDDYVPVLYAREGELSALRLADDLTRHHVRPILQVISSGPDGQIANDIERRLKAIALAARERVIYLEVFHLDATGNLSMEPHVDVIRQVHDIARSQTISFIPVARVGESDQRALSAIGAAARSDHLGVALRYRFQDLMPPPGHTRQSVLEGACRALGCQPGSCDLVLDMGFLDPYRDYPAKLIVQSIDQLMSVASWRGVILLGSSMPGSLGGVEEGTTTPLVRLEWDLWTSLDGSSLARQIVFGDFGIQGPKPPAGGGWKNMRASIRYTASNKTFVARGIGPIKQLGREQYRGLCRQIIELDQFTGPDYSEGDRIIYECAVGARELGRQSLWRLAGTSHHLKYLVDQIGQRVPPGAEGWADDYVLGRI